jgi:hypothetical protein
MGKESFGMQMEIFTKASGKKIRQTVMAFTFMLMEPNMKASGKTTFKMAMVLSPGLMEVVTKATIEME